MSSLSEESYATDDFIEAVRKRLCIWKSSSPDYVDKKAKRIAWEEVLAEMCADYEHRGPEDKVQMSKLKTLLIVISVA